MGYREALKARNRGIEGRALQKSAKKKSLWSSIGKTVGGIAATALTGGAAAPWAAGLMAGAGSFVGGAVGTGVGGKVQGGSFFREEAADLNKELGAFGGENITSALKSGLTAGIGQKLKLMKSGETAAKGLDFKGSFVGKGAQKLKTAKLGAEYTKQGWIDPNLQGSVADGGAPIVAMDRRTISPEKQQILASGGIADRFGLDKSKIISGETVSPMATDLTPHRESLSSRDVAYSKGTQFHSKNVFGVGDKAGEVIPISEATPRPLQYGDQTVTGTYGSRETGKYFAEDTPKVSAWDKFKDFVDVSDTVEERDLMSQIEGARSSLPESTASNYRWTPPGVLDSPSRYSPSNTKQRSWQSDVFRR
jgi:hypothetical protein